MFTFTEVHLVICKGIDLAYSTLYVDEFFLLVSFGYGCFGGFDDPPVK